jgi:ferric-dicitrate binding protein FerR (iron transport regulator)
VLKAADHLVVVLDHHTSIQLGRDDTASVLGGCAYVRATKVSVKAPKLTAQCRNVEAIIRVNEQGTKFSVARGECIVRCENNRKTLTGGQRALVLRDRQEMNVDEQAEPVWPWITESLETVDSLKGSNP